MATRNYYTSGGFNLICDVCGKKIKAEQAKHRWDGLIVCDQDYEERHPQDFIRARQDKISIPFSRPRPVDAFILWQAFFDTTQVQDNNTSVDYLVSSPQYFAEDYLVDLDAVTITIKYKRDFSDTALITDPISIQETSNLTDTSNITDATTISVYYKRSVTDTTTISDTGSIFLEDYIESGYFLENYVGTTTSF